MFSCLLIGLLFAGAASGEQAHLTFQGADLIYHYAPAPESGKAAPLLVVLGKKGDAELAQWQPRTSSRGWNLVVTSGLPLVADPAVKVIEAAIVDADARMKIDPLRVYLAGDAAGVVYTVSRAPDLWAAALSLGGSPRPAINSNKIYKANSELVPIFQGENLDELAKHHRDPLPAKVDCETGNPAFGRCYWIEMTKFDPNLRNDVLGSTRLNPGAGAALALGGFGFNPAAPGPGVLVEWLPDKYSGPLKLQDRIIAMRGKEIHDGNQYAELMDQVTEAGPVVVTVQRGKARLRIDTKLVLPKREELVTARIQAEYSAENHSLLIISRTVAEFKLQAPPQWIPFQANWNGQGDATIDTPGCWLFRGVAPLRCK